MTENVVETVPSVIVRLLARVLVKLTVPVTVYRLVAAWHALGAAVRLKQQRGVNVTLLLSRLIAPAIERPLPSSDALVNKLIAPLANIVPLKEASMPTSTAPLTWKNTLLAVAPFVSTMLEFVAVVNALFNLMINTPDPLSVNVPFNEVAMAEGWQ
ncbi:hypothetical protein GCM10027423_59620 [Spirosoma arcticum]